MKIHYIDDDELEEIRKQMKNYGKPDKPKKLEAPKLDNKLITKVGKALYQFEDAKEVLVRVRLKDGTLIAYRRDEDEDRFENIKRKIDEREEND